MELAEQAVLAARAEVLQRLAAFERRAAGGGIRVLAGWSRRGGCGTRWPG